MRNVTFPLFNRKWVILIGVILAVCLFPGCWLTERNTPNLEVSLYFGVDNVVRLGDSEEDIAGRGDWEHERTDLSDNATFRDYHFSHLYRFRNLGITAYFRFGRVALIEIQEPFHGRIHGKEVELFSLKRIPASSSWEEILRHEFGPSSVQAEGGRLSSQALFYPWGDISYNGLGPNQIALYRDPSIVEYRRGNFGRVIRLFDK